MAATPEQHAAASGARRAKRGDFCGEEIAGRYYVHERLGEGGMGVVYVAEHLHLKKRVALKVIHPELAAREELLLRFKREALATGQLDHPHIAAAIDFGELEDGGAFIVMPLVRGQSLQGELDEAGAFEVRRAARLGAQIADALSAAHSVGIVHRDLKPDNVLVERRSDGSEAAKVLDFGVASLAGQPGGISVEARPLTQAGTILGTPGYMSPEQATAGEVDHRTDLYALGVILWELCRGERLFDGDDITQIFAKQFKSLPPALELGAQLPNRELSALVARLLAWDKNARPSSASEVRDALRRIAELPESRLPDISLSFETLRAHPFAQKAAPYLQRAAQKLAPHRKLVAGVLALLLAFWLFRGGEQAAPPATKSEGKSAPSAPVQSKASKQAEPPAPEVEPAPSDDPEEAVEQASELLLRGRTRETRRAAAKQVLRNTEEAPRYLQLAADLELADRCVEKKRVLAKIKELDDDRLLPALDRLMEQPRRGCGLLTLSDCLGCLRRDLAATVTALEQK